MKTRALCYKTVFWFFSFFCFKSILEKLKMDKEKYVQKKIIENRIGIVFCKIF